MPGRVPPKTKTIDVEVNLLSERIQERERVLNLLSRRAMVAAGVVLFTIVALPPSLRLQAQTSAKAAAELHRTSLAEKALADERALLETTQPAVQETQMLTTARRYVSSMLANVRSFINASSERMAFSSVKVEVMGGDIKVNSQADAESYAVARDFVARLAKHQGVKQVTLKKWRQNSDFAAAGVSFEVAFVASVATGGDEK